MTDDSRARSHEITVPRTARYAALGGSTSPVEEIWLACHGYGQLASRFIRRFDVIDDGSRLIVAPEALSRFYISGASGPHSDDVKVGASWMTREGRDAEIADQVTYLDLVWARECAGLESPGVRFVGFGFSQGAAAVCRWAARTSTPPDHLILWGSGVPVELLEGEGREGLARSSMTIVLGARDPIADGDRVAEHRKQLDVAGLSYRLVMYDGGHEIDGPLLAELAAGLGGTRTG
ncbi:MAG: alpha/beta hydrolase [Gemmatimonadaceae bacterium]